MAVAVLEATSSAIQFLASMRILLIGSGGRENALAWKLAQSPRLEQLYAAPGNPGIAEHAALAPLDPGDQSAVLAFAHDKRIDLVVIGPEQPLVSGLADILSDAGIAVFGPKAAAAQLEGSKSFTKALCIGIGIPTAEYRHFTSENAAAAYIRQVGAPIVVKVDGLAAGKGVVVAETVDIALAAIAKCFDPGPPGGVVIEELLVGSEASLFALSDGETVIPFGTAQDYKRALNGNQGPNTGGMGAISPAPTLPEELVERAMDEIIRPMIAEMKRRGTPFSGALYAGLMISAEGPKLIEFNVRFGDPRVPGSVAQAYLRPGGNPVGDGDRPPRRNRTVVVARSRSDGHYGQSRLSRPPQQGDQNRGNGRRQQSGRRVCLSGGHIDRPRAFARHRRSRAQCRCDRHISRTGSKSGVFGGGGDRLA